MPIPRAAGVGNDLQTTQIESGFTGAGIHGYLLVSMLVRAVAEITVIVCILIDGRRKVIRVPGHGLVAGGPVHRDAAAGHVAIGVIGVGVGARRLPGMGASACAGVAISANVGFARDVAHAVIGLSEWRLRT